MIPLALFFFLRISLAIRDLSWCHINVELSFLPFFKRFYSFIFRQKGREGNINVWLPLVRPQLGIWPTIQACALTGNQTNDPLVHRLALNPLSYTSQGSTSITTTTKKMPLGNHTLMFLSLSFSLPSPLSKYK